MLEWIVGIAAVLVLLQLERVVWHLLSIRGGLNRIERVILGRSPELTFQDNLEQLEREESEERLGQ
jgi:hypothetical protein